MTLNLASAASIQALRGQRRIVLLSAPDATDSKLMTQQGVLKHWQGAAERDVTEIEIVREQVSGVDDLAADLRIRYRLPNDRFAVVLGYAQRNESYSKIRSDVAAAIPDPDHRPPPTP